MEIRDADIVNAAVFFAKDSEECHLPVPNDTGVESDNSTKNESQFLKQEDIFHCLSGLYAEVLLVITGVSVLSEILHQDLPLFYIHDYIFLYIFGMGILLLIGVYAKRYCGCFSHISEDNDNKLRYSTPTSTRKKQAFLISPYFKVGGFLFGSIVIFVTSLEIFSIFASPTKCLGSVSAFPPILRCIFISLQICFLKNPNEIISHFGRLRDFALMHLFAANGATWILLLLWESARDWEYAFHLKHNSSVNWSRNMFNFTLHSLESDTMDEDAMKHYPSHVVHYTSNCWWRIQKVEDNLDISSVAYCLQHSPVGFFWGQANRFLYPFMAQYYFIITGILYAFWLKFKTKRKNCIYVPSNTSREANMRTRSTKGFFLGCIIFVVTIIIVIIFFTIHKNLDMTINVIYFVIFSSSSFTSLLGLSQIKKMLTWKSSNDICFIKLFQKIGLFALLVYATCGLICEGVSEDKRNVILALSSTSMIVHGCTQYVFVIQVSRKKVDVSNIHEKPGRQAVAFLILCNLSLWFLDCFVNWNNLKDSNELSFGDALWPVVRRCLLPFVTFYRLHSFVTLVEIWSQAYN